MKHIQGLIGALALLALSLGQPTRLTPPASG